MIALRRQGKFRQGPDCQRCRRNVPNVSVIRNDFVAALYDRDGDDLLVELGLRPRASLGTSSSLSAECSAFNGSHLIKRRDPDCSLGGDTGQPIWTCRPCLNQHLR